MSIVKREDASGLSKAALLVAGVLMFPILGWGESRQLSAKEVVVGKPYAQWEIRYPEAAGNPYDIEARASH